MKRIKKSVLLTAAFLLAGFYAAAQEEPLPADQTAAENTEMTAVNEAPPSPDGGETAEADGETAENEKQVFHKNNFLLTPLNSSSIWKMLDWAESTETVKFEELEIARNPAETVATEKKYIPPSRGVYFGVPSKSAASVISVGVIGTDTDRFLSTTAFRDTNFKGSYGYFGLDKDSLSTGVSRKFSNGTVAGLYYNGNIIEDIFAYIANNSLTNGRVAMKGTDSQSGLDYDWSGDLKNMSNIDSRTNVDIFFGFGNIGLTAGYSQKLYGLVRKSDAKPVVDPATNTGVVYNTTEAVLDNAIAPHLEVGFSSQLKSMKIGAAVGLQVDIHQHRELNHGEKITLPTYPTGGAYTVDEDEQKLLGDYIEPALAARFEGEFPSDDRSQFGFGVELGVKTKIYSNLDDKGDRLFGVFWADAEGALGASGYENSVTKFKADVDVLLRPSVRYVTSLGSRLTVGLSGGFGLGMRFISKETKTYTWNNKAAYLSDSDPYDGDNLTDTTEASPIVDVGLYPNLGIGFLFYIVPDRFSLNGGVGGTQALYRVITSNISSDTLGEVHMVEQSWGKPLAQFALGATFKFKENFNIDALFSSNGISFDGSNFVIQVSASF